MNFEDEHYVRAYTRDTKTWLRWGWEGQCVFLLVLRKLDKAGVLDDIDEPVEDIALLTGLPSEVVEVGLPKVLKSGALELVGSALICPRYIEGQTAKKSDAARAKESRKRRSDAARASQIVTDRHEIESTVTPCDEDGRDRSGRDAVTDCDADVTNRDGPSRNEAKRSTADQPRHSTQSNAVQSNAGADPPYPPDLALDSKLVLEQSTRGQNVRDTRGEARTWPAVRQVIAEYAKRHGKQDIRTDRDRGVQAILRMFVDGYSPEEVTETVRRALQDEFWRDKGLAAILADPGRLNELRRTATPDPDAERAQRIAAAKASQERASEAMKALVDAGAAQAANANLRSLSALKGGIG